MHAAHEHQRPFSQQDRPCGRRSSDLAFLVIAINLVTDLLYRAVDPRIEFDARGS